MLVLGTELGSCGRAVLEELYVFLTPEPSLQPEGRLLSDVLVGALFALSITEMLSPLMINPNRSIM